MKKLAYGISIAVILLTTLQSSGESWWQERRWQNRMESFVADQDLNSLRQEQESITNSLKVEEPGSPQHNQLQARQEVLKAHIQDALYKEQPNLLRSIKKHLIRLLFK